MVERRQGESLLLESPHAAGISGELGGQELERDAAVQVDVLR